ncbi:IPT/TIG domain-containing protein [Olivibacter sitiensis]|uniref:IPT/TIG domain-containing protein n=1 Tax=Olivibacter sitiensis TaxID=376470 RepID=UPI0004009290|nr:IPT/TIG domain-containing protein [Olivibacter sitiensis]
MKKDKLTRLISCILSSVILIAGCQEKEFSEDYDINLPVSEIIDFNPKTAVIDQQVTVYGENLDMVTSLSIGAVSCEILSQEPDKLIFKVSRSASADPIVVNNKYKRRNESSELFVPQYLDADISQWPSEIERGQTINITGQNVDMILSLRFEGVQISKSSATETTATFSTAGLELPATGQLTAVTRTGQTLVSPVINVVEPKDTYIPKKTIVLFDFDTVEPTIRTGDATGAGANFTSGKNLGGISPFFGSYYSVIAPLGNGWNGQYQYLEANNNGNGFNLSDYNDPHITFLVNTNGKQGYFNPALTIGGATEDKHFTGQEGQYSDNYRIATSGWEWRSYRLTDMGFANAKTSIDRITLFIRGGNVGNGNSEAFELHIDQVMITDGPLNPLLIHSFETMPQFNGGTPVRNGGTGFSAIPQGQYYFTVKDANVSSWQNRGTIRTADHNGNKFDDNKMFYVNFLVNTGGGNAEGYFQLIFEQSSDTKLGYHFKGGGLYGDDYKFKSTGGSWQWRSYPIDPKGLENWGTNPELDLNTPFNLDIDFSTGNVNGPFEVNLDYFVLTSVPLDPNRE